ncbi:LuxR C-terminal-related transcriptional regulator [Microvirga solisilvae]|uniref:LuxR C-terminal-related transcriptional regulator n=1 Tax=Microvirga solisilvae TaxID=2919498 RepID=UPI001FAFF9CE|nr:response regulator transcription factor [Microvirga solisilvae]
MESRIRIGVIDPHPLFRDGIVLALNSQPDLEVVGQGATSLDILRIIHEYNANVLVIDASLLISSMTHIESIRLSNPQAAIMVLADAVDEEQVHTALRSGIRGYLLKGTSRAELVQAVRALHQGQSFLSPSLAAKLLMHTNRSSVGDMKGKERLPHLTPREQQILSILIQGRSNKEIGNTLDLSEKTIKHHLTNILQKLRVRNRVEAALFASSRMPQDSAVAEPRTWPKSSTDRASHAPVIGDNVLHLAGSLA